jgi:hypothetical protein
MVRLVFRPYTQVRRTICTSVSLRASTRVSSGFTLLRHSSPSFGSRQACYTQTLHRRSRSAGVGAPFTFIPHAGLPPEYSHTCQTPWSVFLDGSEAPIPSAGTPAAAPRGARQRPHPANYAAAGVAADLQRQSAPRDTDRAPCGRPRVIRAAESALRGWAHPGFLLPISSTL